MKTSAFRSDFYFPRPSNIITPTAQNHHLLPTNGTSYTKQASNSFPASSLTRSTTRSKKPARYPIKTSHKSKSLILEHIPNTIKLRNQEVLQVSSNGYSRFVILGAVTVGFVMLLEGMDEHKALALGPGGPLMEDFWDNMRRYGLYALTVSSGALYTIFLPILELLKNPISAILIIVILGGSFYIVSQVLSAMIGVSEFAYDYGY